MKEFNKDYLNVIKNINEKFKHFDGYYNEEYIRFLENNPIHVKIRKKRDGDNMACGKGKKKK